ncbi:MAG: APC family permease [Steroidobacter sp.]
MAPEQKQYETDTGAAHESASTGEERASGNGELARGLGGAAATAIIMGGMIGSGIFRAPSIVADHVGSPGMSLVVWIVCGFVALAGGLCVAELGAMMPKTGGLYVYLREAYPRRFVSFSYAWAAFWLIWPVSMAAVAAVFATYLAVIVEAATGVSLGVGGQRTAAAAGIVSLALVNCVGVRTSGQLTTIVTALKIASLAAIIALAALLGAGAAQTLPASAAISATSAGFHPAAFGAAMITALFAFEGWSYAGYVAGEIQQPQRTLPRAVIVGVLGVTTLYVAVNLAYMSVLPFEHFRSSDRVAADVMSALVGPAGGLAVSAAVMTSTFGALHVLLLVAPRSAYALAQDRLFFQSLTRVHPIRRTPTNAIAAQAVLASAFVLSGRYDEIISLAAFPTYLYFLLTIIAVFVLRRTRPDAVRPYRAFGYPVTPLVCAGVIAGYLVTLLIEPSALLRTVFGLLLIAAGIPFYLSWRKASDQ